MTVLTLCLVAFLFFLVLRFLYWGLRPWTFRIVRVRGETRYTLQVRGFWFNWIETLYVHNDGDITEGSFRTIKGTKQELLNAIDGYYKYCKPKEYDDIYYPGRREKENKDLMLMELGKACAQGDEQLVELILNKMENEYYK